MESRHFSRVPDQFGVHSRIVEPELDMNRDFHQGPILIAQISRLVRWLMPQSRQVGPPMRSIAREMEERFPSRDN